MKKISFKIRKNVLIVTNFTKKDNNVLDNTICKTNIIDVNNIYFSSEYLLKNRVFISNFLKELITNHNIDTVEVENMLIQGDVRRKKRKKVIDKLSAVIILQGYIDSPNK